MKNISTEPESRTQQKPSTAGYWFRLLRFTVGVSLLGALFLFVAFVYLQLEAFTTPKRVSNVGTADVLGQPYQEITLTTRDGLKITAWFISGTEAEAIVLVHGINANRRAVLPEAKILAEAGYHLLLLDLRGHGHSEGDTVSYGYWEALDVLAAVDYLAGAPGIEKIGALGTSLGGAAVVRAAALDPRIEAVVIESSYSSLPAAIEDAFDDMSIFPKWPFAELFVVLAEQRLGIKADQINSGRDLSAFEPPRPVFIIHGANDQLFPPHHAQIMYAAAQEPKFLWLIDDLGHANPVIGREKSFKKRVVGFFQAAFEGQ